ncbi:MAG: hypothetical protein ABS939_00195 [Psychrobacillus sp.]
MLGIKDFEFYSGDKSFAEYMLSKLIIAKQIESMGIAIPDHYLFYENFHVEYVDREFFLEPVSEFLKITNIGEMNIAESDGDEMRVAIQFNVLDSLVELEETERLKNTLALYKSSFIENLEGMDLEHTCTFNKNQAELTIEYWVPITCMKDLTKAIMEFHQSMEELIQDELERRS